VNWVPDSESRNPRPKGRVSIPSRSAFTVTQCSSQVGRDPRVLPHPVPAGRSPSTVGQDPRVLPPPCAVVPSRLRPSPSLVAQVSNLSAVRSVGRPFPRPPAVAVRRICHPAGAKRLRDLNTCRTAPNPPALFPTCPPLPSPSCHPAGAKRPRSALSEAERESVPTQTPSPAKAIRCCHSEGTEESRRSLPFLVGQELVSCPGRFRSWWHRFSTCRPSPFCGSGILAALHPRLLRPLPSPHLSFRPKRRPALSEAERESHCPPCRAQPSGPLPHLPAAAVPLLSSRPPLVIPRERSD